MASFSKIEWTEVTWNPVTGCSKISEGCRNCYAERMANRLHAMGNKRYRNGFQVTLHQDLLDAPLRWKKSKMIFVNSMSDLFHEQVSFSFLESVFKTMGKAHWHIFQIVTKRSKRLAELAEKLEWPSNVWMGVTVESNRHLYRIKDLQSVPASIRFVSMEPLLSPLAAIQTERINWIIVGGESGPKCRMMKAEWVRSIREKCISDNIPFFFKQWGGVHKSRSGRRLDGRVWNGMPGQIQR